MLSTCTIKTKKFHTQKFTFKNINFKKKKFCSLDEKILNREYFNSFSDGMKKLHVREYFDFYKIPHSYHRVFPFGFVSRKQTAYFTGKIRARFHIQDHKNFGVDVYLYNYWGGYDARHLKELSPLDFTFYLDLLFEKISYYSEKKITFFMEIDFNLEGKVYEDPPNFGEEIEENLQMGKESYFTVFYR